MINHKQIIMKNFDENSTQKIKKIPKSSNMITSNYSGNKIWRRMFKAAKGK